MTLLRLELHKGELHCLRNRHMRDSLGFVDPAGRFELRLVGFLNLGTRLFAVLIPPVGRITRHRIGANPGDHEQSKDDEHDEPTCEGEDAGRRMGGIFSRHVSSSE